MTSNKRGQHTLFEAGNMKESGYGNKVISTQGVAANVAFMTLIGPKKDLFAYTKPKLTESYLKEF